MEIIQATEATQLLMHTKGKESAMSGWIKLLAVGELLKVSTADWNRKRPPYAIANYISKKTGRIYQCGKLPGFDGWVIKRLS